MQRIQIILTIVGFMLLGTACEKDPDPIDEPIDADIEINQPELTVYKAPPGSPKNFTYNVYVRYEGGEWIDLHEYDAGVDGGFEMQPNGHMAFVYFDSDFSKKIDVKVVKKSGGINDVKVRPESAGVMPAINGNEVVFTLTKSQKLSVEFNGDQLNNLMVFANEQEASKPEPESVTHYFGPGEHKIGDGTGVLTVGSDESVYIAGGAIVYGHIEVKTPPFNKTYNVSIKGRGILSGDLEKGHVYSHPDHGTTPPMISIYISKNVLVEGIIIHNSAHFNVHSHFSKEVTVKDVKIMSWTINSDGIGVQCTSDVLIDDCFIRNFDDGTPINFNWVYGNNVVDAFNPSNTIGGNVTVQNSIYWQDHGRAVLIGPTLASTRDGQIMENITVRNMDILYAKNYDLDDTDWAKGVLAINCSDDAVVRNVLYEDIRVDELGKATNLITLNMGITQFSETEGKRIENVVFNNVSCNTKPALNNFIHGIDDQRIISGIEFNNLYIEAKHITNAEEGGFDINEFTELIEFN